MNGAKDHGRERHKGRQPLLVRGVRSDAV